MKWIAAVIGFVVGAAVTAAVCTMRSSARQGHGEVQLLSNVHDPLRQTLNDIVQTYERGDTLLAQQKSRLLQQRWSEYLKGGRAPEQFANEVMNLGAATTLPDH